jgi:hypothetical protein
VFDQAERALASRDHHVAGLGYLMVLDLLREDQSPSFKGTHKQWLRTLLEQGALPPHVKTWVSAQTGLDGKRPRLRQRQVDDLAALVSILMNYFYLIPAQLAALALNYQPPENDEDDEEDE